MVRYTRAFVPGGTFFFTLVTHRRRLIFKDARARDLLHKAIEDVRSRRPFELDAVVLLPDHMHCLWTLPPGDADFSVRWRKIKESFTRAYVEGDASEACVSPGQRRKGLRGVWQQRFWEHTIRDETDFRRHLDYIHYNPVKHGQVSCPHRWPWSSFSRWVDQGVYASDWCCGCDGRQDRAPDFEDIADYAME